MRTLVFVISFSLATALSFAAIAEPHGARLTFYADPATTMAVSWTADDATENVIIYGTDASNLTQTMIAGQAFTQPSPLNNSFTAQLSGLSPNQTYHYRVGKAGAYHPPTGEPPLSFSTMSDDACDPFTFILIGDNRADTDGIGPAALWPEILAETLAHDPDFYVNTGDMVKNGEVAIEWANFVDESESGWAAVPSILTIGNHDDMDDNGPGALYAQLYELPHNSTNDWENYYSIDVGPIHLVSLDSNAGGTEFTGMTSWLSADLAATTQPWKIAFFHHAIYSRGNHETGEESDGSQDAYLNVALIPIFDSNQVDFVFNGHSHDYERFAPSRGVDSAFGGSGRTFPAGNGAALGPGSTIPDGATGTTYMVSGGAGSLTTEIGGFECIDAACTFCTGFNINCDGDVYDKDVEGTALYDGAHNYAVFKVDGGTINVEVWSTNAGNTSPAAMIDNFTITSTDFDSSSCGGVTDPPDAGPTGGEPDAGPVGGQPDAGTGPGADSDNSGCGCRAASSSGAGTFALLGLALLVVVRRRRR